MRMISPLSHQINQTVITKVWSVVTNAKMTKARYSTSPSAIESDAPQYPLPENQNIRPDTNPSAVPLSRILLSQELGALGRYDSSNTPISPIRITPKASRVMMSPSIAKPRKAPDYTSVFFKYNSNHKVTMRKQRHNTYRAQNLLTPPKIAKLKKFSETIGTS